MADRFDILAQALLKKPFSACSKEELFDLTERYPYLAPARFLYLKKLDEHSETYQKQYQKAVLYYSAPAVFDHFLHQPPLDTDILTIAETQPESEALQIAETIQEASASRAIAEETLSSNDEKPATPAFDFTFEPFHTVDYFASQGIKLSQEERPNDKLGRQVKSFTEWLKVMKKLPVQEMATVDGRDERQVENMAAYSVKSADVITESMAEVWLRQGNKQKAIEVYRKLSLLNPAKNAYFAAKIDNLKDSN